MLDISPGKVLEAMLYSDPKSVTLEPIVPVKSVTHFVQTMFCFVSLNWKQKIRFLYEISQIRISVDQDQPVTVELGMGKN